MTDRPNRGAELSAVVVVLALVLGALNFRPAMASVPPILEVIRAELSLSYTAVSLLTAAPVFCMGLFAFLTPRVARRGRERALFWAVAIIGAATAARLYSYSALVLFGTTLVVGVAIAVGQTLLPALVGEYFPDRTALVTGLYSISLAVGATLGSGMTAPIYGAVGSWPFSLAIWAVLAVLAAVAIVPLVRHRDRPADDAPDPPARLPWNDRLAWVITLFFAGTSTVFYSGLTWLAPRYVALGWSEVTAGFLLTVFVLAQVLGMAVISAFGDCFIDRRPWIVVMGLLSAGSVLAIAYAPLWSPWLWNGLFGVGAGGLFTLALTLPVDFATDGRATDRLATMAMGFGYMIAAVGPFLIGGLRDVTGEYAPAFAALCAVSLLLVVTATSLAPARAATIE